MRQSHRGWSLASPAPRQATLGNDVSVEKRANRSE